MARDKLFLLKPGFMDQGKGPFYCPGCASIEGILGFYPSLREEVEVRYIDFPRPRPEVIEESGNENQGLPALVLHTAVAPSVLDGLDVREWNGRRFLKSATDIGRYLARTRGIGEPH